MSGWRWACRARPGRVVTPMPAATNAWTTVMSSLSDLMRGVKPARSADRDEFFLAAFAAADPGGVAVVREGVVGALADQVDRVLADVNQAKRVVLGRRIGVPEDEGDVDVAVPEHLQRLDGVTLDQAEFEARGGLGQRGGGSRHQGAQGGRVGGQADPAGLESDLGGEFLGRRVDPADDLGGPVGEQPAFRGEPDPATDSLDELDAGRRFQPGQVMTHRRLRSSAALWRPRSRSRAAPPRPAP